MFSWRKLICNIMSFIIYFFTLWNVVHSVKTENVARGKTATQLSAFNDVNNGFEWTADKAVDGVLPTTSPEVDRCCSASQGNPENMDNYWEVHLGGMLMLGRINIIGRPDNRPGQLQGFQVYIQNETAGEKIHVYNNTGATFPSNATFEITIEPVRNVTIIRVERPASNNIITLCEVEAYEVCDDGTYGPTCSGRCGFCQDGAACHKETGTCLVGCQGGWQGDLCIQRTNVLLNKTVTLSGGEGGGLATDGCTNQTTASTCCCSTDAQTTNAITVNLGGSFEIGRVFIYGKDGLEGQLSGFLLYDNALRLPRALLYNSSMHAAINGTYDVIINPHVSTRSLIIERISNPSVPLTVCEVEAFTVCPAEKYGDTCLEECGHCLDNDTCHGIIGTCARGCSAGWRGDTCKDACQSGTFGANCNRSCGVCKNSVPCDVMTGACPAGCDAGYQGVDCLSACTNGTWGLNCSDTCGNCVNDTQCEVINGTCPSGCAAGYQGVNCTLDCVPPQFGDNCMSTCYCTDNATCDRVTGACPSTCQPGWHGSSCSETCVGSTFGQNCSDQCGNCRDGVICDVISGDCPNGCAPGWINNTCKTECNAGFYGDNCSKACGNCADDVICDLASGACPTGCAPGWTGNSTSCKTECSSGRFGPDCAGRCFCANGVACNATSGVCPAGCDDGVIGEFCHIDLNRAIGKASNQSSTYFGFGFLWNSSLAVDGDWTQSNPTISRTCSQTDLFDEAPSWQLDMESVSRIENILVYGRTDMSGSAYLSNFTLHVSNTTDVSGLDRGYVQTGAYGEGIFNVSFPSPVLARYVTIALPRLGALCLCEVRVFGDCADGTFGVACDGRCYCAGGAACDKDTGECPAGGCSPGYTGLKCDTECNGGKYGDTCLQDCGSCANDDVCDHVTGRCPNGCSDGWLNDTCQTECSNSSYGVQCNETCGWCKNNASCNHVNGSCPDGCAAGYKGKLCKEGCANGTYGENCAMICGNCVNDTVCDTYSGSCDLGCDDGFTGETCSTVEGQIGNPDGGDDGVNTGAIVGGIFGALAAVVIVVVAYKIYMKRSAGRAGGFDGSKKYDPYQTESNGGSNSNMSQRAEHEYDGIDDAPDNDDVDDVDY